MIIKKPETMRDLMKILDENHLIIEFSSRISANGESLIKAIIKHINKDLWQAVEIPFDDVSEELVSSIADLPLVREAIANSSTLSEKTNLAKALAEKDKIIANLQNTIMLREEKIISLKKHLNSIYGFSCALGCDTDASYIRIGNLEDAIMRKDAELASVKRQLQALRDYRAAVEGFEYRYKKESKR